MDREHPIPQEVSTYEFRLVGDMTIKQFMQVAAGALISLVLYSSSLAPYVKWPLIILSFLTGVALAFFPIEDRPLGKWIILFLKAIYSPTVYVWDKSARKYEFFQPEPVEGVQVVQSSDTTPTITTDQSVTPTTEDKLEKKEQEFLNKVDNHFTVPATPAVPVAKKVDNTSIPKVQIPVQTTNIPIPSQKTVKVEPQEKEEAKASKDTPQETVNTGEKITPIATQTLSGVKTATFSQEASPPMPPTRPNVVVGQVLTPDGIIIDGAILEIKDTEGRAVRALRSNRLGHFMIVTPLANGSYRITTEKDGFIFDPVSFEAKDEIIPPIQIWAKK